MLTFFLHVHDFLELLFLLFTKVINFNNDSANEIEFIHGYPLVFVFNLFITICWIMYPFLVTMNEKENEKCNWLNPTFS